MRYYAFLSFKIKILESFKNKVEDNGNHIDNISIILHFDTLIFEAQYGSFRPFFF